MFCVIVSRQLMWVALIGVKLLDELLSFGGNIEGSPKIVNTERTSVWEIYYFKSFLWGLRYYTHLKHCLGFVSRL